MIINLFLTIMSLGDFARFKANRPNAIPPDPTQVQAAQTGAGFNNFLPDVTHVPGGRDNPDF